MADKKKLLILGGIIHMIEVVETAKKMGIYTIVTDNGIDSPAKKYADKSYDISTADIESLVEMAKTEKIHGVFTAFDDINTWNALNLCERLGLPFYATKEQLEISSKKDNFKEFCRRFEIPVIEDYPIAEGVDAESLQQIAYPVIIKPVDSYASKGITVCRNLNELQAGYNKALSFSKTKQVIIERFVDTSYGVELYYTVQNSEVFLTAVTDRYVHQQTEGHPPLPIATIFPSRHAQQYIDGFDLKVREMIKGMRIKNGLISIQSVYENDSFYFYEMGFRLTGEKHYQIIEKQIGINLLEMMLDLSIGESIEKYSLKNFDNCFIPFPSCNLSVLLNEGTIQSISGLEHIEKMPVVIDSVFIQEQGSEISLTGSYAQMLCRFNMVAPAIEELQQSIKEINNTLRVLSVEGKEMIATVYSPLEVEERVKEAAFDVNPPYLPQSAG